MRHARRRAVRRGNSGARERHSAPAPPIVREVLRSPGQPLDIVTRRSMEPRFGYDFSSVRVHHGERAAESARSVGALAYTTGSDIVFDSGRYAPGTAAGRQILAHELTHIVQNARMGATPGRVSRYTTDECETRDLSTISTADATATAMAGRAVRRLRAYRAAGGRGDPRVAAELTAAFGFSGLESIDLVIARIRFLDAVIAQFQQIADEFQGNDYQYECEDDCDDENAYVYGLWTDIHLCMDQMRGRSNTWMAGVMLHEMSHYAAGTDDNEYFYSGTPAVTTLRPASAVLNADSYESFAEELYKNP